MRNSHLRLSQNPRVETGKKKFARMLGTGAGLSAELPTCGIAPPCCNYLKHMNPRVMVVEKLERIVGEPAT